MFEEGRYEAALAGYQTSYDLQPHPFTLYNLALTHERLLHYDEAIAAFERYLAASPIPGAADRTTATLRLLAQRSVRRLRAMPARLSVSAVPSHVEVTVTQDPAGPAGPPPAHGQTPTVFTVPAGRYTLRLRAQGYFDEQASIEAHVGQALLVQRQLKERPRRLLLTSTQPASLFLDARPLGKTPYDGPVEVGRHYLRAERLFYLTDNRTFDVHPGPRPVSVHIDLRRSGLYDMVAGGAVAGAALGLFALRLATSASIEQTPSTSGAVLASLLPAVLGAGLFGFAAGSDMPAAEAQLIMGNAAWGTTLGLGLGLGVVPFIPSLDPNGLLPHILAASVGLVGGVAGLTAYRLWHSDSGTVAVYNSAALWGNVGGALVWGYLAARDSSQNFFSSQGRPIYGGWALAGGAALGMGAGILAAKLAPRDLTRGQVALVDLGAAAGGLTAGFIGLGVGYAATGKWQADGRISATSVAALATLGGSIAGLVTAVLVLRLVPAGRLRLGRF